MRYQLDIEDSSSSGDLLDIAIYCSAECFREDTGLDPFGHYMPCPEMTDSRQCCPRCETVTVAALSEPSFDSWPDNPDVWPES